MAQKLKFGNGTWATKEGSTLAYNDENNNYKPLPFTTTRDSIATRVNKEGLIEVVGKDIPRIDYTDSADGVLLLEKSSTNLVTQSEAFDNAYWIKPQASVVSGQSSPSGDTNAFKLVEDTSNNFHWLLQSSVLSTAGTWSYSIFAKAGGRDYISMGNASNAFYSFFDLQNGTVVSSVANAVGSIEPFSNGWYRCTVKLTTTGAQAIGVFISTDGTTTNYQGDGTSGVYIYGAQLEQGNASSYIPTNGSTVQRAADTASGAGNSQVFNDSQGVLFADIAANANDGLSRNITISDGTSSNRVFLKFSSTSNLLEATVVSSGVVAMQETYSISDATLYSKLILKYKQNDFSFWVNGFEVGTDSSGNTPTGLDVLDFDSGIAVNDFYGKAKEIGYYDEILTDLELEYLTSYRSLNELVTELNLNTL